jgi:hypothetical protein
MLGSLVLDLGATAVPLLWRLEALANVPELVFRAGTQFLMFAAWLLFMVFLQKLADYLRGAGLARQVRELLLFGTAVWLGVILLPFVAVALVTALGCFGILGSIVLGLVLLMAGVGFLMQYVRLLVVMREVIE